jgi:predicted ATPase
MTIQALRIQNFKCFEDQRFELGPLTLLTGLNGTGKSSVLQSLLLLRQSYQQNVLQRVGLALNGDLVQLGTASDVFYEAAASNQFGFELSFGDDTSASWCFEYDREADVVRSVSRSVPRRVYQSSLFRDRFQYLSAERIGPRTSFPTSDYWVREHRQLGPHGEYAEHYLSLFGDSKIASPVLAHPAETSHMLRAQVEAWMGEVSPGVRLDLTRYPGMDIVGLQYSFVAGRQVSNPYRPTNVGFGITYTLPVVVALLASSPGGLVLLENPEAHLHPQGQVRIAELMARAASCGIQVMVESHSDHILNGLRIAVRSGLVTPEQARLYYFSRWDESGPLSSSVISPRLDRNGRIDQWPEGFFDEWDKSLEKLL